MHPWLVSLTCSSQRASGPLRQARARRGQRKLAPKADGVGWQAPRDQGRAHSANVLRGGLLRLWLWHLLECDALWKAEAAGEQPRGVTGACDDSRGPDHSFIQLAFLVTTGPRARTFTEVVRPREAHCRTAQGGWRGLDDVDEEEGETNFIHTSGSRRAYGKHSEISVERVRELGR